MAAETTVARESSVRPLNAVSGVSSRTMAAGRRYYQELVNYQNANRSPGERRVSISPSEQQVALKGAQARYSELRRAANRTGSASERARNERRVVNAFARIEARIRRQNRSKYMNVER